MAADLTLTLFQPDITPADKSFLFLRYTDEDASVRGSWQAILDKWDSWSCAEKVAWSKGGVGLNATDVTVREGSYTLHYRPTDIQQATRPRYWFYAFARCEESFKNAEFRIHSKQLDVSSWDEEFGWNEHGLNTVYLTFFFFFTVLLITNSIGTYRLQQKLSYVHPMIKLFLISLVIEYLSIFLLLLHYGSYAQNGTGIPMLLKLGQILSIVSRCFLMLLLLLLAKGWTISNETLTKKWAVVSIVLAYLGVSVVILVFSYAEDDPMRTTPTSTIQALSILLSVVWLVFACWFSGQIFAVSYKNEDNPAKKSMYLRLGLLFTPWFFMPALAALVVFALDPWARERIVAILTVCVTSVAYSVLVFLFWPSRADEYFAIATPDIMGRLDAEDYSSL